jgi:hypothetical protein
LGGGFDFWEVGFLVSLGADLVAALAALDVKDLHHGGVVGDLDLDLGGDLSIDSRGREGAERERKEKDGLAVVEVGKARRLGAAGSLWLGSMGVASAPCAMDKGEGEARRRGSGRREEAEGRGRQRNRVWDPFIRSKRNFSRPFADERSKMIGLFWA